MRTVLFLNWPGTETQNYVDEYGERRILHTGSAGKYSVFTPERLSRERMRRKSRHPGPSDVHPGPQGRTIPKIATNVGDGELGRKKLFNRETPWKWIFWLI